MLGHTALRLNQSKTNTNTMKHHITKKGEKILIKNLKDSHLINIIKYIERRAKEGIEVFYGGCGVGGEDIWADSDTLKGRCALDYLNHEVYVKELKKRNLKI